MIEIRKGQAPASLERDEFLARFRAAFLDPALGAEEQSITRLEEIAWHAYIDGRKAPFTQMAGGGFHDPDYDLSTEWVATKKRIDDAQLRWFDPARASRVSLICGSARNDGTCPGEMSKTFRLLQLAREVLEEADIFPDVPDLSLLTSECGRNIFRAKGAHRPRCRCAIGRAVAIPITHSTRPTTEWPRFKSAGRQPIP